MRSSQFREPRQWGPQTRGGLRMRYLAIVLETIFCSVSAARWTRTRYLDHELEY